MPQLLQEDWGAGIHRGRHAPASAVFDAQNMLINDEGELFKRGGGAQFSTSDLGFTVDGIAAVNLAVGSRVLVWGDGRISSMDPSTGALTTISSTRWPLAGARIAVVDGIAIWIHRGNPTSYVGWAGSAKSSSYGTGSVTVTLNSEIVTGVGTSWTANADAGMVLSVGGFTAVVKSVDSNTALTLTRPWQAATSAGAGYTLYPLMERAISVGPGGAASFTVAVAVSLANRLLIADGERIYVAQPWHPFTFDKDVLSTTTLSFVDMPRGEAVIAMQGIGDTVLVFTAGGVWEILNTSLDLIDDFGNAQWQVQQVNTRVAAWGDPGVSLYGSGVVVPALDDIYIVGLDGSAAPISSGVDAIGRPLAKIRPLYRDYVAAGYQPGKAAVFRGHYFLPIVNGSTLIDVLVCRLDRGAAWTRWNGYAAGLAYALYVNPSTDQPSLFGATAQRVTALTGCFAPGGSNATENGSAVLPQVDTNDFDTGPGIRSNTIEKARLVYETSGGTPTIVLQSAVGAEGASFTAATLKRGGGASDGTDYSAWRVVRKAERVRFRVLSLTSMSTFVIRRLEVTVRRAGQN